MLRDKLSITTKENGFEQITWSFHLTKALKGVRDTKV